MIENGEEHVVERVEESGDRYAITHNDGWVCAAVTKAHIEAAGIAPPMPGDRICLYPGGIGSRIRGVALNGVMLFYRTPEAQARQDAQERAEQNAKKQRELDESRADRDLRWAALPENFQARLRGFSERNPTWRRDFELYELSCCEDGARIAAALQTADAVKAFGKMPWEEQSKAVPDLFDGHSGNSFGMAVRLAYHHVTEPENVWREHGAMCPLVGCRDYGCRQA